MKKTNAIFAILAISSIGLISNGASAADLLPSFATVPSGWTVDRYAPDSFTNVGTYQGHSDVLGIGIGSNGSVANRPSNYSSQFYDTQGMQHAISGGSGNTLSADLYVPTSWLDASNGAVRTDMWAVMNDGSAVSDYPIIGFTNEGDGGYVGFRVWDDTLNSGSGGWYDLGTSGTTGWNALSIDFTGTDFIYSLNGTQVYDQANSFGSTNFQAVIMQAYNFNDPANFPGVTNTPYVANWSAAAVPEPATWTMLLLGFGAIGFMMRSSRRKGAVMAA